jgi:CopZ-like zinc binding protein
METCCTIGDDGRPAPTHCPQCSKPGRSVERITVKALLRPEALARLSAPTHRFCATPECPIVYFGREEAFAREDVAVTVFQKESPGARIVCYCFTITEDDIRRELVETGHSSAAERITALVKVERCACEVKNPQGSCCLGNLADATRTLKTALEEEQRAPA